MYRFFTTFCALYSVQLIVGVEAYPTLNIPFLFASPSYGGDISRYKKSGIDVPTDADVIDLEHLKEISDEHKSEVKEPLAREVPKTIDSTGLGGAESLPELERKLELATTFESTAASILPSSTVRPAVVTSNSFEHHSENGAHRPPMLPNNDGGKATQEGNQHNVGELGTTTSVVPNAITKPFYGAARLAFGQNPEVLPTTSTSTTTTSVAPTIKTRNISTASVNNEQKMYDRQKDSEEHSQSMLTTSPVAVLQSSDAETSNIMVSTTLLNGGDSLNPSESNQFFSKSNDKDKIEAKKFVTVDDVASDEQHMTKIPARRSVSYPPVKSLDNLLKSSENQYSPLEMAQYIFWTGDEAGVAHAVEELIEQGLMTRENALKFLREIRYAIQYLQRSYLKNIFSDEEMRENSVKKSTLPASKTTSTTTSTTEKPFPALYMHLDRQQTGEGSEIDLNKPFESVSIWQKLQQFNNDQVKQELSDYDDPSGRSKVIDFLYTEQTLEDILYKLAKVMFTQSLGHGSNEAQQELQKLTDFLEREGNLGIIPIDLQKKILHVLLRALSDTLSEHPELLSAARTNLVKPYKSPPLHLLRSVN